MFLIKMLLAIFMCACVGVSSGHRHGHHRDGDYRLSYHPYYTAFKSFTRMFRKSYRHPGEAMMRYAIFRTNVKDIENHNRLYHAGESTYYMGVNQFTDLTQVEFMQYNRMGRYGTRLNDDNIDSFSCSRYKKSGSSSPDSIDWRSKGAVTSVKDQQNCGSCYIFSATETIEGQLAIHHKQLISLSEQQIVDCCTLTNCNGCGGGIQQFVYQYLNQTGGLEAASDYEYKAKRGKCRFNKSDVKVTVTGCVDLQKGNEDELKDAVANVGPISVRIDATGKGFRHYAGGVYYSTECAAYRLDHAVLAAGYGTLNGSDYWLVKNSWGENWGLKGYIMMSRNRDNNCGIASDTSYPLIGLP